MPNQFTFYFPQFTALSTVLHQKILHRFSAWRASRRLFGLMLLAHACVVEALDFTVVDVTGRTHTLAHSPGEWVVINFWASWCPTCIQEISDLNTFHARPDAMVIGINIHDQLNNQELEQIINRYKITYPVVRATPKTIRTLGPVPGLPMNFLINPAGKLIARYPGAINLAVIENLIQSNSSLSSP